LAETGTVRDTLRGPAIVTWLLSALAASLLAPPGCTGRLEEQIAAMHEVEGEMDQEIEGFRQDLRVLQPLWNVADALSEADGYQFRFHDFVRERFAIEEAYRSGKAGRVETRRQLADFLARARSFVETVRRRRDEMLSIREMSDEAAVRLSEIAEAAGKAEGDIERIGDEKQRILFRSRILALRKGISEAQTLLETGMREMQVEEESARIVYRSGLNKLAQIGRSIRDLAEEVRSAGE
jgi:hypothetical protein